jgi:RNA polymerase primary sigma factor
MKTLVITPKITVHDSEAFKRYLQDISKYPLLTPKEELMYAERAINGDKVAHEILITSNLRFVVSVAKLFVDDRCKLEDLVNEGNEGLISATKKFDPSTGFKFISYAVWWIRQSIMVYKSNYGRLIRIPNNKLMDANKVRNAQNKFEIKFNREPSEDELFELLEGTITLDKLQQIYEINQTKVKSLDFKLDEDGSTLVDITADNNCELTDYILTSEDETEKIKKMLSVLSPVQREVIILSYGLTGEKPKTLAEIGVILERSRERIRQIRDNSIKILQRKAISNNWAVHYQE